MYHLQVIHLFISIQIVICNSYVSLAGGKSRLVASSRRRPWNDDSDWGGYPSRKISRIIPFIPWSSDEFHMSFPMILATPRRGYVEKHSFLEEDEVSAGLQDGNWRKDELLSEGFSPAWSFHGILLTENWEIKPADLGVQHFGGVKLRWTMVIIVIVYCLADFGDYYQQGIPFLTKRYLIRRQRVLDSTIWS